MRSISIFILVSIISCNGPDKKIAALEARIDSLEHHPSDGYKPGFGEFMSSIQMHHAKLWFAGINNRWELAQFEIDEIREAIADIKTFNTDRPESKELGMLDSAMDSVAHAIGSKDVPVFRKSFSLLTNTCNNCHRETAHAFNVITIPEKLPVTNQDFGNLH
jgi:hypothetical protein